MAERRKGKKRKEESAATKDDPVEKASKEETDLANWMKKHVPTKKTKFLSHNVIYFTGTRAVDAIMESKFHDPENGPFKSREDVVELLDVMLAHKFFHRARKVPIHESELNRKSKKKAENDDEGTAKPKTTAKDKDGAESSVAETKADASAPASTKEKKKMKIRLEMHIDQRFVDSLDAYVWIYDPIPLYYWAVGAVALLGCVGLCLFPLWPHSVRVGVYYLSIAAAGFLVSIIVLAVLRLIFFCAVWLLTLGKHHVWMLPNLTEDVGFFASFWPLYTYEYRGDGYAPPAAAKSAKKRRKKDKESDGEEEQPQQQQQQQDDAKSENNKERPDVEAKKEVEEEDKKVSESESESSQRSSTGRDFEMVEEVDVEST